jgi:hypothetical protein
LEEIEQLNGKINQAKDIRQTQELFDDMNKNIASLNECIIECEENMVKIN